MVDSSAAPESHVPLLLKATLECVVAAERAFDGREDPTACEEP